jgi:hypothetical protein
LALSGGGHRAAVWAAGAVLGLVDADQAKHVVSASSVSGGSIANGVIVASGDLRSASRADMEAWLKPGLQQWAHSGLFFSGPATDRWVAGTLGLLVASLASVVAALTATISASRGWASATVIWVAAGLLVAMVLVVGLFAKRMPARVIGTEMLYGAVVVWPLAFLAITAATASAWWLLLVWPVAAFFVWFAIKRFGNRSVALVEALGRTLFAGSGGPVSLAALADRPVNHLFCATNLRSGNNVYLSNRITWGFPGIAGGPTVLTLANAVQASACLPGAFLARTVDVLPDVEGGVVVVSDGGAYDNMADQWELGFANRRRNAEDAGASDLLDTAQPEAANYFVVVNASRGMDTPSDMTVRPGLMGEIASALAAKDVLYDVSTTTRRRLLIDVFRRAQRDPSSGPSGMLIHIGTSPYEIASSFSRGDDAIAIRSRAAIALLDKIAAADGSGANGKDWWAALAEKNSTVATTLGPLEKRGAGTTAALLHHSWVLTRISAYVLHSWGELGDSDIDDWRRARFDGLVAASK